MALDTPFVRFLRAGGKSEFTVSLKRIHSSPEWKNASFNLRPYFQRFLELLDDADTNNHDFLSDHLGDVGEFNSEPMKQRAYDEFENRLFAVLGVYEREGRDRDEIAALIEADINATKAWGAPQISE